MSLPAATRVFAIAELREMILLELADSIPTHMELKNGDKVPQPALKLLTIRRVNKAFNQTIETSMIMQQRMWLATPNLIIENPNDSHYGPLVWLMGFLRLLERGSIVQEETEFYPSSETLRTRTITQHEPRAWPRAFKSEAIARPEASWRRLLASFHDHPRRMSLEVVIHGKTDQTPRHGAGFPKYIETIRLAEDSMMTLGEVFDCFVGFLHRSSKEHYRAWADYNGVSGLYTRSSRA